MSVADKADEVDEAGDEVGESERLRRCGETVERVRDTLLAHELAEAAADRRRRLARSQTAAPPRLPLLGVAAWGTVRATPACACRPPLRRQPTALVSPSVMRLLLSSRWTVRTSTTVLRMTTPPFRPLAAWLPDCLAAFVSGCLAVQLPSCQAGWLAHWLAG